MNRSATVALLALLSGAGLVPAARAQVFSSSAPQVSGLADERAAASLDVPVLQAPSQRFRLDLGAVPQVAVAPVDARALLREDEERAQRDLNKVLRYGIGRAVHAAARDGSWYRLADGGRLWVLDVVSPGALGVRIHLSDLRLPRSVEVAVYAPDDPARVTVYAGDQPSLDSELWTPTVIGERARLEVRFPAGAAGADGLPFTIDHLQHLYVDPVAKEADACNNDVTCYPEWAEVARAVGGVGTIAGENALYCTGQLLNSVAGDHTPYFLTAHHCLSTPQEARASEFFWLYQTATCGGPPPSLSSVPRSARATLLSTAEASDYTLLMVEGTVPRNLFWAGWTAAPVPDGTASAAIHHPVGDFKRISFGDRAHNPVCGGNNANHVRINWADGVTQPGSSGSGLFRGDTHQLYGQLHCGPSSCDAEPADLNDSFGAFSATYPRIAGFLARGSDDPFEDNDACMKSYQVAPGIYKKLIVKGVDPDWYRLRVAPGRTLTVTVNFTRAWGALGLRVFTDCKDAAAVRSPEDTGNTQTVTFTNTGASPVMARWQVFLRDDTRNSYTMTITLH